MMRVTLLLLLATTAFAQSDPTSRSWNQPVEPFRIAGNLFYVGASDIASYLIATPRGPISSTAGSVGPFPLSARGGRRLGSGSGAVRFSWTPQPTTTQPGAL